MLDDNNRFIIEDYGMKSAFSSFLPGISGRIGIPVWSFYVNRGQCICSFGTEDKEHSIMEFYPAHQAYQNTQTLGFRTFIKVDGEFYEPFHEVGSGKTKMCIGMNELEIEEQNKELGIQTNVLYYTLPGEGLGGLVRKVTIINTSSMKKNIELLDGMPAVIPYGLSVTNIKAMGQTMKAYMVVEDLEKGIPYYKLRTSTEDSTVVTKIEAGHFYITVDEESNVVPPLVDPEIIFGYDMSLHKPIGFIQQPINILYDKKQMTENLLPCGFSGKKVVLAPNESVTLHSIIGKAEKQEILYEFVKKCTCLDYFYKKYKEAVNLTKDLCKPIKTKTSSQVFDAYCEQTYLDNVLRGGYPILLGDKTFYIYGRKHGDIERDYNFFRLLPEFYSQGNGNYRDINQNRRCDIMFAPYVKDKNIKDFYNLIQLDGYNPLLLEKTAYTIQEEQIEELLNEVSVKDKDLIREHLLGQFTPGSLLGLIYREKVELDENMEEYLEKVMKYSKETLNASFGEGYWTDHWTYNLDLIESYLSIYPDKEEELLCLDKTYTYYEGKAYIRPRKERYVITEHGVRQHNCLDITNKKEVTNQYVRIDYGKGKIYTSNLLTKLVTLSINKYAVLDPYGMGIEMEGGKPGWYDALNGLPGIFGSSMAETYELSRMNEFIQDILNKYQCNIELPIELYRFMMELYEGTEIYYSEHSQYKEFQLWNLMGRAKEAYRDSIRYGIQGEIAAIPAKDMKNILNLWQKYIKEGIEKAMHLNDGICPTYFAYELIDYDVVEGYIVPKKFQVIKLPHFLEGTVRYLKLSHDFDTKSSIYKKVKESSLYDAKLQMYKVCESLENASFELGRAKAFTSGWLENESIWLHMEYKYLLELLKSGLYTEYFMDFKKALIPFMDAEVYRRSILENSSFIASSANPDEKTHGKGFVARLSGATAEFINIWQIMMFGLQPFSMRDGVLVLKLTPAIPDYLIGEGNKVECTFLGKIKVIYQLKNHRKLVPMEYKIASYEITYKGGRLDIIDDEKIFGEYALDIREGKVISMVVNID